MKEKIQALLKMNEADDDIIPLWNVISDVKFGDIVWFFKPKKPKESGAI